MTSFAGNTAIGMFWGYLAFLGTKGVSLVSLILLARLLGPETFGLMALCTLVIVYFEIVARFGLGAALVSVEDHPAEMETAVAVMALISAAAMAGLAWMLAPVIAAAFDAPELIWPLRVIALALLIDAAGVVPVALMARRLQFRRKVAPDLARSLVKASVAIGLALGGMGLWSLVWGHVAGTLAASLAAFAVAPWRPKVWPRRSVVAQAFRFGRHLLLAEMITAAQRNLDALLIGKLLGPAALGIYTLAFRLPDLVIRSFTQIAGSVLHPVISASGADRAAMARLYLLSLRHVALVTFPAGAALAVAARPLVELLYTPDWGAAIQPMACLAVALAIQTIDHLPGVIYKAMMRTDLLLWTALVKLPLFVAVLLLVAPYGIKALAAAQIGLAFLYAVPNWLILRRIIGVGLGQTLAALGPAVVLAAAMAGVGALTGGLHLGSPAVEAPALGLGFALVFLAGIWLAVPELRLAAQDRWRRGRL